MERMEWKPQDADKDYIKELIRRRVRNATVGDNVTFIPADPVQDVFDDSNKKVAVYTRVSTKSTEQVSSIENQTKYYTEKVSKNPNWDLQEIYSDEGKSGTSIKKRENFRRMIEDAKNKKIDLILCASVSRFARNLKECLEKVDELRYTNPKQPVGVYFETDNIFTLNPNSDDAFEIHAWLADWESKNKSRRMILSYDQRICTGQYPVADLLGYRHTIDGQLILQEEEAKTVKFIFFDYALGYSYKEIAEILTEKQRPTLKGRTEWNSNMVRSITKNERRWGDLSARKTVVMSYKLNKVVKNDKIRDAAFVSQHHEGIVSPEIARAVHFITSSNSKLSGISEISVIKQGSLKGFINVSPYWNAIDSELFYNICKSAYSEEEFSKLQHEVNIMNEKEHSNIYSLKYTGYQVPYGIYFMNSNTPTLTISNKQIKFNKKCHEKLGSCEYIEILYHPIMQTIILKATNEKTSTAFRCRTENDHFSNKITSPIVCHSIYEHMEWIKKYDFKFRGILRERGQVKILMFFLDEPQILVEKNNELMQDGKSVQYIKYKNNDDSIKTFSIDYSLRKQRDKLADTITESDINISGELVENPKIGKIPTKLEIKQELDELLKAM